MFGLNQRNHRDNPSLSVPLPLHGMCIGDLLGGPVGGPVGVQVGALVGGGITRHFAPVSTAVFMLELVDP